MDAERIVANDQILLRQVSADGAPFMETVGSLVIRRRPVMLLGISSPTDIIDRSSAQTRNWMLIIFGVALALIVGIRLLLARRGVLRTNAEANGKVG